MSTTTNAPPGRGTIVVGVCRRAERPWPSPSELRGGSRGRREREARPVVVAGQRALRLAGGAVDDTVAAGRQAVHAAEALPVGEAGAFGGAPGEIAVRKERERVADGAAGKPGEAHE